MDWDAAVRAGRLGLRVRLLCAVLVAAVGITVAVGTTEWRSWIGVVIAVLGLLLAVDTRLADAAAREAYRAPGGAVELPRGEAAEALRQRTAVLLHRRRVRALGWFVVVVAGWVGAVAVVALLVVS